MSSHEYPSGNAGSNPDQPRSDQPRSDRPGAAESGYPTGQDYSAGRDYSTQADYAAGQSYSAGQNYAAGRDYPPGQGYPADRDYPTGQQGYQPATTSYPPTAPYQPPGGYPQGWPSQPSYPDSYSADPVPASTKPRRRPFVVLALVAALLGGGVGGGIVALVDHSDGKSVNTGLRITNDTGAPAAQLDGTVGAAAAKIRPSVVTINVTGQQEAGTGSGVIIRDNGTILTNDHVVDIANGVGDIQVVLADGRTAPAKIVGRDTSDDLAVIKVDGLSNLTAATFAKSSSLSVGQTVVAVGAPLGLSDTVTSGIVSSVARPVRAGDNDQAVFNAVQTDAAINPGNSGGPLVDLNGSVVGINAAIATNQSGGGLQIPGQATESGNIGIGFAIPSDEASRIASELIATGKATHAVLGVQVTNAATTTGTAGVTLHTVTTDGVADKAGLKAGDLITKIGAQQVTTADALIAAVRSHAPGEKVDVTYTRGGKSNTVAVTLGSSDS
jgi:putative serine protease PepD